MTQKKKECIYLYPKLKLNYLLYLTELLGNLQPVSSGHIQPFGRTSFWSDLEGSGAVAPQHTQLHSHPRGGQW